MRLSLFRMIQADPYFSKYNFTMTPLMLRARRPYFWKNLALFMVLSGISLSVYVYTYSFLTQDDFEGIPIPPVSDEDLAKLQKDYKEGKIGGKKQA